jgi:hypothetical protein
MKSITVEPRQPGTARAGRPTGAGRSYGQTEIGKMTLTDRVDFHSEDTIGPGCAAPAGIVPHANHAFRLMIRKNMFELYLDDIVRFDHPRCLPFSVLQASPYSAAVHNAPHFSRRQHSCQTAVGIADRPDIFNRFAWICTF